MRTLRVSAYVFALVAIAFTVPLTLDAGRQGIVVAVLGGTLAVTPYMVFRAIEELTSGSVQSARNEAPAATPPCPRGCRFSDRLTSSGDEHRSRRNGSPSGLVRVMVPRLVHKGNWT